MSKIKRVIESNLYTQPSPSQEKIIVEDDNVIKMIDQFEATIEQIQYLKEGPFARIEKWFDNRYINKIDSQVGKELKRDQGRINAAMGVLVGALGKRMERLRALQQKVERQVSQKNPEVAKEINNIFQSRLKDTQTFLDRVKIANEKLKADATPDFKTANDMASKASAAERKLDDIDREQNAQEDQAANSSGTSSEPDLKSKMNPTSAPEAAPVAPEAPEAAPVAPEAPEAAPVAPEAPTKVSNQQDPQELKRAMDKSIGQEQSDSINKFNKALNKNPKEVISKFKDWLVANKGSILKQESVMREDINALLTNKDIISTLKNIGMQNLDNKNIKKTLIRALAGFTKSPEFQQYVGNEPESNENSNVEVKTNAKNIASKIKSSPVVGDDGQKHNISDNDAIKIGFAVANGAKTKEEVFSFMKKKFGGKYDDSSAVSNAIEVALR